MHVLLQTVQDLIQRLKLTPYANKAVHTYSGGMKRKLSVAISLLGDPDVVFLVSQQCHYRNCITSGPGAIKNIYSFPLISVLLLLREQWKARLRSKVNSFKFLKDLHCIEKDSDFHYPSRCYFSDLYMQEQQGRCLTIS